MDESYDGVGLIKFELDQDGSIGDHELIDIGSRFTSFAVYNNIRNEIYVNVHNEDTDFVIYHPDSGTYEPVDFTEKTFIFFCVSTDGNSLFFAVPSTNEILEYELE